MTKDKKITIETPGRLDIELVNLLGISRSQAQKLITEKRVFINEKLPKKMGEKVREGDQIVISSHSEKSLSQKQTDRDPSSLRSLGMTRMAAPKIIAVTPDYVVIEKPTGMLTHPTQAKEKNSLVNFLVKKYPDIKKVGDDPSVRPGIVHRLDKEASGLLVVARTQKMFNHLKEQFKNRTVEKEYYALAHGKVAKDWDVLNFPIARSETSDRMAARPILSAEAQNALSPDELTGEKEAKTEFIIEKRFINFTLLRVTLHTGRMHQIRVHMLAYNHPLVGDPLYKQKKRKSKWDEKLGRLFLHSTKLSFTDLDGNKQTFESSLPKELEEFIKQLT